MIASLYAMAGTRLNNLEQSVVMTESTDPIRFGRGALRGLIGWRIDDTE